MYHWPNIPPPFTPRARAGDLGRAVPTRCRKAYFRVAQRLRHSQCVGLGYAVCPVGTAWVGKRFWRSELRASSSCPIRCVISPKWAIPPPIWPTREAPSAASSSDAPGGGENAMISESIEPSGTSMPSLKYALIARAVCSPVNLRYRTPFVAMCSEKVPGLS